MTYCSEIYEKFAQVWAHKLFCFNHRQVKKKACEDAGHPLKKCYRILLNFCGYGPQAGGKKKCTPPEGNKKNV